MMDKQVFVKWLLLFCMISLCRGWVEVGVDSCKVVIPEGIGTIDITSLGNSDSTPRFKDVKCENDANMYSYNPCGEFVEGSCMEAAACMTDESHSQYMLIGRAGTARYQYDSDRKVLLAGYFSGTAPFRLTEVEITCDVTACEPKFAAMGSDSRGQIYKMSMTTICACPNMCDASGPTQDCQSASGSGGSMSGGSIFLIILFASMVIYFIGGVLYMKIRKKASGSELIPNKELWKSIPTLVKTGFMFLLSKCTSRKNGYINS